MKNNPFILPMLCSRKQKCHMIELFTINQIKDKGRMKQDSRAGKHRNGNKLDTWQNLVYTKSYIIVLPSFCMYSCLSIALPSPNSFSIAAFFTRSSVNFRLHSERDTTFYQNKHSCLSPQITGYNSAIHWIMFVTYTTG